MFDQVYWQLGKQGAEIPAVWPRDLQTEFNIENQMSLPLGGGEVNTYLSVSTNGGMSLLL